MAHTQFARTVTPAIASAITLYDQKEVLSSGPELAAILDLTDRRIRQLCDSGMPRAGRGKYPRDRCIRWYVEHSRDSAHEDRRFSALRVMEFKEKQQLYRTIILEAKVKRALGDQVHSTVCRRIWSRDLRKIGRELDRLLIDICSDPTLSIEFIGKIAARFDTARSALGEFEKRRERLFAPA